VSALRLNTVSTVFSFTQEAAGLPCAVRQCSYDISENSKTEAYRFSRFSISGGSVIHNMGATILSPKMMNKAKGATAMASSPWRSQRCPSRRNIPLFKT
jgi:hypothetical protein